MRHLVARSVVAAAALLLPPAAPAQGAEAPPAPASAVSLRLGIPADVLANLSDLYDFGVAVEGAWGRQVSPRLVAGAVVGYGLGRGTSTAVAENNHYLTVAGRLGLGRLEGLSASLLAGVVWIPRGDTKVIPDLGLSLDWGRLSVGLSVGSVSVGMNFRP